MISLFTRTALAVVTTLGVFTPSAAEAKNLTRQTIVQTAKKQLGIPYVWGGASRRGFDCSGLVQYVFAKAQIRLPRTADRQYNVGTAVPYGAIKQGDLMFFNTGTRQGEITHVGIYMGNHKMIHAPRTGAPVRYAAVGDRSWFRPRLLGIRRVERKHFELTRRPIGWEVDSLPKGIRISVTDDEVRLAAMP